MRTKNVFLKLKKLQHAEMFAVSSMKQERLAENK